MDDAQRPSRPADRIGSADGMARAAAHPLFDALLRSLGGAAAILDGEGRVLALGGGFLHAAGVDDPAALLGLRLGEAPEGWSTASPPASATSTPRPAGAVCGAAIAAAAAAAAHGLPARRTCSMSLRRDGVALDLDLAVRAEPLEVDGQVYFLVTLADVSGERRRATLERVLLHDLTNLAAGLTGACGALDDPDPAEAEAAAQDLRLLVTRLSREIQIQRALASGRPGAMRTAVEPVPVAPLLDRLRQLHQGHRAWIGKRLTVDLPPGDTALETDGGLLQRLVAQMLTNAFEATGEGGEVRLTVTASPEEVEFRAWNAGAMPPAVAARVFERFFSTKAGEGRGQGTYSLKVFGEAYLKGQVGFSSTPEAGTTFALRLPRSIGAAIPPWGRGAGPS